MADKTVPDFSLIMGTVGRAVQIGEFLESLLRQEGGASWEFIIVDQNDDDRLVPILKEVGSLPPGCIIRHLRCDRKGLSLARNQGLEIARGRILAFPDDDCLYAKDVLKFVLQMMLGDHEHAHDAITLFDTSDRATLDCSLSSTREEFRVNSYNIFSRAISYTIFISGRFTAWRFDERFGVGARFGAAEETDYLLSLHRVGTRIFQITGPRIFHPDKTDGFRNVKRAFNYNVGIGAFFRKNLTCKSVLLWCFFLLSWFKILLRLAEKAVRCRDDELKWYCAIAKGRIEGWRAFAKD